MHDNLDSSDDVVTIQIDAHVTTELNDAQQINQVMISIVKA